MITKTNIQEEALTRILPLHRSGVGISMGVGKTLLGLKHMDDRYKKGDRFFLIVAPKKAIWKSWQDDAVKFQMEHLLPFMKFSTYIGLKKQPTNYVVVYFDECHSLLYSNEPWLSEYKGQILGLTGTPPKHDQSEKGQMVTKYCPIAYDYIVDDAVEDGILNDYRIIVHKIALNPARTFQKKTRAGGSWMTSELNDYQYWSKKIDDAPTEKSLQISRVMRMKAMQTYPSKEQYARKLLQEQTEKCILFCNTIDQAHKMAAHSFTSKNPKSDKNLELFKSGDIDKLSCVLQLSEGVNIPGLKVGIIMHSYGNERKSSQRIGRLLRLNPNDTAEMHILCYNNTIDEQWTRNALADYDPTKITWI